MKTPQNQTAQSKLVLYILISEKIPFDGLMHGKLLKKSKYI